MTKTVKPSKTFIFLSIIMSLLLLITGCNSGQSSDISSDALSAAQSNADADSDKENQVVTLTGLKEEDTVLTVADLHNFDRLTVEAKSIDSKNNEVTKSVKGVDLEQILSTLNQSIKDYKLITFIADDGYSISVNEEIIALRKIIIALEIDGKKGNPGIAIPDERTMYWVKDLVKIEFEKADATTTAAGLFFFESMTELLEIHDYDVAGEIFKSVKLADVTELMNISGLENVNVIATDGFEKTIKYSDYLDSYIRFEGENSPFLGSQEMPKGMTFKFLYKINFKAAVLIFNAFDSSNEDFKGEFDGQEGILLGKLLESLNFAESSSYVLSANDGYSVKIEAGDIHKGIIFQASDGTVSVKFDGLPKNTSVKKLISIASGN